MARKDNKQRLGKGQHKPEDMLGKQMAKHGVHLDTIKESNSKLEDTKQGHELEQDHPMSVVEESEHELTESAKEDQPQDVTFEQTPQSDDMGEFDTEPTLSEKLYVKERENDMLKLNLETTEFELQQEKREYQKIIADLCDQIATLEAKVQEHETQLSEKDDLIRTFKVEAEDETIKAKQLKDECKVDREKYKKIEDDHHKDISMRQANLVNKIKEFNLKIGHQKFQIDKNKKIVPGLEKQLEKEKSNLQKVSEINF